MSLSGDRYRDQKSAQGYDAHRRDRAEWRAEHELVGRMVSGGTVIDVPVGTGRFFPIYAERGMRAVGVDISQAMLEVSAEKNPGADFYRGDIFRLPFPDASFDSAVCIRFLNWCEPADMARAIAELRRVARTIVLSIRTGRPGLAGNYTHGIADFYKAIIGLFIEAREQISIVESGTYEMFKLRPPVVGDVFAQFGEKDGVNWAIKKALDWTRHFGLPDLDWSSVKVLAEYWPRQRLEALVRMMALIPKVGDVTTEIVTDEPPRIDGGTLTALRVGGHVVLLDGRRRANRWMNVPGRYPVLVVEPA